METRTATWLQGSWLTVTPYRIRRKRPELRLIISSATIDAEAFQAYFNAHTVDGNPEAAILSVEGRMFPVDIAYLAAPTSDYVETSVRTIFDLHVNVRIPFNISRTRSVLW